MSLKAEYESQGSSRENFVSATLIRILQEVIGVKPGEVGPDTSFLALGADSLSLLQVSQSVKGEFGVHVPFRMLLDSVSNVRALASYICEQKAPPKEQSDSKSDEHLTPALVPPPGALQADGTREEAFEARLGARSSLGSQVPGERFDDPLAGLVSRQLDLMSKQLELMRHAYSEDDLQRESPPTSPDRGDTTERDDGGSPAEPAAPDIGLTGTRRPPSQEAPQHPALLSPRLSAPMLDARQARYLEDLITRVVSRTDGSKQLAARSRSFLADIRAASGFRLAWKEMVYLLAVDRASGARIWDVDGNEYIDITMGFGALLFGHSPAFIMDALKEEGGRGMRLGLQSPCVGDAAQLVCELTGHDRATFCNSGTEAVMTAIRLARTATGRSKLAKFSGSYHGFSDQVLVGARRSLTGGLHPAPMVPGVPGYVADNVLVLEYGSRESLEILEKCGAELAAVLVEPLQSRRPYLDPREFLTSLRRVTADLGVPLICDEVISGFRFHAGGAQAMFGIQADIATYGKAAGGGLPIGIVAGNRAFMDTLDGGEWSYGDESYPNVETTFVSGTFFKHPLTISGIRAALEYIKKESPGLQNRLNEETDRFASTLNAFFEQHFFPVRIHHFGSLFLFSFPKSMELSELFYYHLLAKGVYVWERRLCYFSTAHTKEDIDSVIRAVQETVVEMSEAGLLPETAAGDASSSDPKRSREAAKTCAMTESQQGLWALTQVDDAAARAYNESVTFRLTGGLDLEALTTAVQSIVNRHEVLRATLSSCGSYLRIQPRRHVDAPVRDFTTLDVTDQERRVEQWLEEERYRPFDLNEGPLLRVCVAKLDEQEHFLLVVVPHVIIDGFSFDVFLTELSEHYGAHHQGLECTLPPAQGFTEYESWLREWLASAWGARSERYWLDQLRQPLPILDLHSNSRPAAQTYRGARVCRYVEGAALKALKVWSAQQGCTLFMTLLAVFNVLLRDWSGQTDIVLGVHSAGQMQMGAPRLLGYCINVMALRTRVQDEQSFESHLQSVKSNILEAQKYQNYPFSRLIQKLNLVREPARPPLVNVVFNMDRARSPMELHGLRVSRVPAPSVASRFDLSWNIVEEGGQLTLESTYAADLFDEPTVTGWLDDFLVLLDAVPAPGGHAVRELIGLATRRRIERRVERGRRLKQAGLRKLKALKPRLSELERTRDSSEGEPEPGERRDSDGPKTLS